MGLSLCLSEKMATIQIRKWSCWPESLPALSLTTCPYQHQLHWGTAPPLPRKRPVRAIEHSSELPGPLFRPNHPRGRGKGGQGVAGQTPHSPPKQTPNSWALGGLLGHGVLERASPILLVLPGPWTFISYRNGCGALEATGGLGPVPGETPLYENLGGGDDRMNAASGLQPCQSPLPTPPPWGHGSLTGLLVPVSLPVHRGSCPFILSEFFLCPWPLGVTGKVTIIDW